MNRSLLSTLILATMLTSASAWAGSQCRAVHALKAAQQPSGWSWERSAARVAPNVSGVIATALAASPSDCDAREAVLRYADNCVARHDRGEFLFDPDVEALAAAAKLSNDPRYLEIAHESFQRRYEYATGEEIVERWFMIKRDARLIGFEAAAAIRAALAVNEEAKAMEIAAAVIQASPRWAEGSDTRGFLTTSRGAMLEALSMLQAQERADGRTSARKIDRFSRDLVHHLLLTQSSDGSWDANNTQATAYAVRGLRSYTDPSAQAGASLGVRWLSGTQLKDGSWATFNDHLPEPFVGEVVHEVTAEVLLALRPVTPPQRAD